MYTTDTKKEIIEFILQNGSATNHKLRQKIKISKIGMSKHIKELKDGGIIYKDKEHFTYYLTETVRAKLASCSIEELLKTITSKPNRDTKTITPVAKGSVNTITPPSKEGSSTITPPSENSAKTITPLVEDTLKAIKLNIANLAQGLKDTASKVDAWREEDKANQTSQRQAQDTVNANIKDLTAPVRDMADLLARIQSSTSIDLRNLKTMMANLEAEFRIFKARVYGSLQKPRGPLATYTMTGEIQQGLKKIEELYDKKDHDGALMEVNHLLQLYPDWGDGYTWRGLIYFDSHRPEAISDFTTAIELNPTDACAYRNRGVAYHNQGLYDLAWEDHYKTQSLGWREKQDYIELLKKNSGREK